MTTKTIRLRSRHAQYRWGAVRFENHIAHVSEATLARAKSDRYFGQGRDFWVDAEATPEAATEAAPAPGADGNDDGWTRERLEALSKKELLELAAGHELETHSKMSKAELVDLLFDHLNRET